MTDLKWLHNAYTIPFEQAQENLRKVFEEYGVSKKIRNIGLAGLTFIASYSAKTDSFPKKAEQLWNGGKTTSEIRSKE